MAYYRFSFTQPEINVSSLTYCVLSADYGRAQPHDHPFGELFFVMKGTLIVDAGVDYRVSAGEFAFVPAGATHKERALGDMPCEHYIVALDAANIHHPVVCPFRSFYNRVAADLAEARSSGHNPAIAQALTRLTALRALQSITVDAVPAGRTGGSSGDVKTYIDGNFASDLTLGQLASVACVSEEHLIRTFERAYGVSPMRYVKKRRLAEGEALLVSTRMDVQQIASLVGYNAAAHFSADFRTAYGMTPTAYRRQGN